MTRLPMYDDIEKSPPAYLSRDSAAHKAHIYATKYVKHAQSFAAYGLELIHESVYAAAVANTESINSISYSQALSTVTLQKTPKYVRAIAQNSFLAVDYYVLAASAASEAASKFCIAAELSSAASTCFCSAAVSDPAESLDYLREAELAAIAGKSYSASASAASLIVTFYSSGASLSGISVKCHEEVCSRALAVSKSQEPVAALISSAVEGTYCPNTTKKRWNFSFGRLLKECIEYKKKTTSKVN